MRRRPHLNPLDLMEATHGLPPVERADALLLDPPEAPPELINGVLHQGSKMIIGGASKGRKSWMLLDLAVCVSEGLDWWGFPTSQAPTLYINMEIQPAFAAKRIKWIQETHMRQTLSHLYFWNLRGHAAGMDVMANHIHQELSRHQVGLLILDPLYKVLGDREENANTEMAQLMNQLEGIATAHQCAVAFAHHFRKGGPGDGPSMDRMSGAGVFSRDPDTIITMQDHEDEECVVVTPTLRNFPPHDPFGLRWDCPTFTRDDTIDTSQVKGRAGAKPLVDPQSIATWVAGREWSYTEMVDKIEETHSVGSSTAKSAIRKAIAGRLIEKSPVTKKYSLTLEYGKTTKKQ